MNDRVQARLETGRAIQTHSVIPVAPLLQQKCASNECVQRHGRFLQTNVIGSMESTVPASAPQALQSEGQPLDAGIRGRMESRFGHDFGQVRVHADAAAAESAWSVDALAYTLGTDVVFARGQYAPHTAAGQKILAHELAHVIQQSSARATTPKLDSGPNDPSEQAADDLAGKAMSNGENAALAPLRTPALSSVPSLQRYSVPGGLACSEVVDWLDNNSPYKPEWAETRCTYSFNGGLTVSSENVAGGLKLRGKGHNKLTVGVSCPVDRPEWSPSRRTNRGAEVTAWRNMRSALDAHENEHRKIGREWKDTLEGRFRAVDITVTGADASDARQQLVDKVQAEQQAWTDDAQAAQDAIDPFRGAVLTCP
jgi:hypothetical protein